MLCPKNRVRYTRCNLDRFRPTRSDLPSHEIVGNGDGSKGRNPSWKTGTIDSLNTLVAYFMRL